MPAIGRTARPDHRHAGLRADARGTPARRGACEHDTRDVCELRDAGRDTYTPATDALAQLLPAEHRFVDVHAGMLATAGDRLDLPTGAVPVPAHMRRSLMRQRTTSVLCNGPTDWPLLTLFDKYQRA